MNVIRKIVKKLKDLLENKEYEKFLQEVDKTKFTNKIQIDNNNSL